MHTASAVGESWGTVLRCAVLAQEGEGYVIEENHIYVCVCVSAYMHGRVCMCVRVYNLHAILTSWVFLFH